MRTGSAQPSKGGVLDSVEDWKKVQDELHGHTSSGLRVRSADKVPEIVKVAPDASLEELTGYTDDIYAASMDVLQRFREHKDNPNMAEVVAVYADLAIDCSLLAGLINTRSLTPPRNWNGTKRHGGGLTLEQTKIYKEEWAPAISEMLSKMVIAINNTRDMSLVDKQGKPAYWAATSLRVLIGNLRRKLELWAKLLIWEERNRPVEDIADKLTEVLSHG